MPQCYTCTNESLEKNLCTKCEEDYYPIYNDFHMINLPLLNCSRSPEGYYLDKNDSFYKLCYPTCKKCEIKGDNKTHNCIKCGDNYPYEIKINNYSNCYISCKFYHYFDDDNNYHCTFNLICPRKYSRLLLDKMECVKNVEIKKMIEDIIKNETKEKTKEEENQYYDTILKEIDIAFTSENFDTYNLDKGNYEIIETEKIKITFTTTKTQKNNAKNNMTTIDLDECEILLRNFYNISNNQTLYMKIIEKIQEGMKISKIEYDVYSKLSGAKLKQLNLSVCQDSKIFLFVPVITSDSLDKLNSSSEYYNDICYTIKSDYGTDISLNDRKNEYVNKTVCQDDCNFWDYNYTSHKAKCSCKVKKSSSSFADIQIDTNKLLDNFKNIKNYLNINLLVCTKTLFSKSGISKNIGSYLIIAIILFQIISLFVFYLKQFNLLKDQIKDIIYAINYLKFIKGKKGKEPNNKKNKENNLIENEINLDDINNNKITNIINENENNFSIKKPKIKKMKKKMNKSFQKRKKKSTNKNYYINNSILNNENNNINSFNRLKIKNKNKSKNNKKITVILPKENSKIKNKKTSEQVKNQKK